MPEGSLTLRVKVLGIEGLRSIPLDLEVSAGETRLVSKGLVGPRGESPSEKTEG